MAKLWQARFLQEMIENELTEHPNPDAAIKQLSASPSKTMANDNRGSYVAASINDIKVSPGPCPQLPIPVLMVLL